MDYLAYSEDLRTVLTTSLASDYEKYVMYTDVVDPLLQMPQVYHKEIRGISLNIGSGQWCATRQEDNEK